jgi:hypothetical protein
MLMASKERHIVSDLQSDWDVKKPGDICKGSWIVTRRGYVVPLDKGKEGIHKKFDEIMSTFPD